MGYPNQPQLNAEFDHQFCRDDAKSAIVHTVAGGPVAYNMQMAQMTPIPQPLGKDWLYLATTATVQPLADLLES